MRGCASVRPSRVAMVETSEARRDREAHLDRGPPRVRGARFKAASREAGL